MSKQDVYYMFGKSIPFTPPEWVTKDDRLRGGASSSHLDSVQSQDPNDHVIYSARFYGHLDTSVLGGAGFASQFSADTAAPEHHRGGEGSNVERFWDLKAYDGIYLDCEGGTGKAFTFILKDGSDRFIQGEVEQEVKAADRSGINWEVEFRVDGEDEDDGGDRRSTAKRSLVWLTWDKFKATYRGREVDAGQLNPGHISTLGIMMRSYFGAQDGDFSLNIHSIGAGTKS